MLKRSPRFLLGLGLAALLAASGAGCASHEQPQTPPASAPEGAASASPASRAEEARRHVQAGNDFLRSGQYDDAERAYRLALEADPASHEALAGLGQVEVRRGRYTEALPLLERATRVPTQIVSAFRSLGDAYAAVGDLEKASISYRQAVALAPNDLSMRFALARALTDVGSYDEAQEICRGSLRIARGDVAMQSRAYAQLGEVFSRSGRVADAISAYYKAGELAPRDPDLARGFATCAARAGLYAEAAAAYGRVLALSPLDVGAKKQLAWVNFKLERWQNSIKDYESVRDSLGTVDRYYLAQAYARINKTDRAVEHFREVIRLDPENYKGVYCNMAYAYYDANRYERAISVIREGLAADSGSACLRYCWAQALDKLGRHEEAIPMFEAVLHDPAYAESAQRELERQKRIVRLLRSKEKGD
ncbi:MAG TPA: tetratricopeptide repeat protein [Candidatus Eisenbacteria bacterium]|jgi:tetratricopeptide (TPR) repeat protein